MGFNISSSVTRTNDDRKFTQIITRPSLFGPLSTMTTTGNERDLELSVFSM